VVGGACIKTMGINVAPFVGFGLLSAALAAAGGAMRYNYRPSAAAMGTAVSSGGSSSGRLLVGEQIEDSAATAAEQAAADEHTITVDTTSSSSSSSSSSGSGTSGSSSTMRGLLLRPDVCIFLGQATALGFGMGVCQSFEFIYLQQLGGSEAIMGLCLLAMTCAGGWVGGWVGGLGLCWGVGGRGGLMV